MFGSFLLRGEARHASWRRASFRFIRAGDPLLYGWSPDGRRLVFASQVAAANAHDSETQQPVVIANTDHKSPLVLTKKTPPEWTLSGIFRIESPSAKWAISKNTRKSDSSRLAPPMVNQVFIVDIQRRTLRQLTTDGYGYFNPAWSPDGKYIVCASGEGRSLAGFAPVPTNIYLIDLTTSKKVALTSGPGDKYFPKWSPDGKWIAYKGGEHYGKESVFAIPVSGEHSFEATSRLFTSVLEFNWLPDSKSVSHNGFETG